MENILINDPAVQAALISGLSSVLAALFAAIGAVLVGQRFLNQKRMQEKIERLKADLAFLLAVEEQHCKEHGKKLIVRDSVRAEGLSWSGRYTPGRDR